MTDKRRGVYGKYVLGKADGSEVDPEATYFVLRLDTDKAARAAARTYAEQCGNEQLANGLLRCVDWLDEPPSCSCGGGRDSDVICPFHDGGFLGHPVWHHRITTLRRGSHESLRAELAQAQETMRRVAKEMREVAQRRRLNLVRN